MNKSAVKISFFGPVHSSQKRKVVNALNEVQ